MDFSPNKLEQFSKKISSLRDQPNMQPSELKAYFDSSPEEVRQAHNSLCDALTTATTQSTAAANIGFSRTAGVPADTIQAAVENVQSQLTDAVLGNIPSGSVTNDKLAQDVRDHFTTVENSVSTEASNRQAADSNLQKQINTHTTQIAAKCEIVCGTYTGNDAKSRIIPLGRKPKAVWVADNKSYLFQQNSGSISGGLAVAGSPVIYSTADQKAVEIVDNGFRVAYGGQYNCLQTNYSGQVYNYIAFF